jgi:hypothetical protein
MIGWSCDVNLMIDGATLAGCAVAVRGWRLLVVADGSRQVLSGAGGSERAMPRSAVTGADHRAGFIGASTSHGQPAAKISATRRRGR